MLVIRQLWKPNVLAFIGLVIADTSLTNRALVMGAQEFNPIASLLGTDMAVRGLTTIGIILALYWFNKEKLLWVINLVLFSVVFWNLTLNLMLEVA